MAGVDNKEKELKLIAKLNQTGREILKQTMNYLKATGSLDITLNDINKFVNQKLKNKENVFNNINKVATSEQRDIINYYARLQVLMNKAYKKYIQYSREFDRLSLKVANLMQEVLSIEEQAGLKRIKNKIPSISSKFDNLPKQYSNKIKDELSSLLLMISEMTKEELEIDEKEKIQKYYNAMITTTLLLSFTIENASKVEAIVKIFEVICKRHKLKNKMNDITLVMASYDEVVIRRDEFLDTIKKSVLDDENATRFLQGELELNVNKESSTRLFNKVLDAYIFREEKMYKRYKSLNKIAKDRIERYLDEEVKSWGDNFDIIDIEEELIEEIINQYELELEVF